MFPSGLKVHDNRMSSTVKTIRQDLGSMKQIR
jgi:hypothetical protein